MDAFGTTTPGSTFIIDDEAYTLVEDKSVRAWSVAMLPHSTEVRIPLRLYGGFGATHRFTDGQQQSDPTHHDYTENMQVGHPGEIVPAQRITYLDLSTKSSRSTGFQMGGTINGQLGGGLGSLGGGMPTSTPESIKLFGNFLYLSGGPHTHVIDPAASTPDLKETRFHTNNGRARSSDVYNNDLYIALGNGAVAERAVDPWSDTQQPTTWEKLNASGDVKMDVFRKGKAGRLYSANTPNLLYQVLPGSDPNTLASFVPSAGEPMGDETHPITALEEFGRTVVAAKEDNVHFVDPDAGFYSRPILPEIEGYPDDHSGRGMFTFGTTLFVGTKFGFWMLQEGRVPIQVGPELLHHNQSPYADPQWGRGVSTGLYAFIPAYFPSSGDSVIWSVRRRRQNEPGTGPLVWNELLFLENRECRVVFFWPGTSSVKPRLFFGAGSSTGGNLEQLGWIDFPASGSPDHPDDSDSKPALAATIFTPADDLGAPGVTDELKRIELPRVINADSSNYLVISASANYGGAYTDLVQVNDGATANDERVVATGFRQVFPPTGTPIAAESLKFKIVTTQASGATTYVGVQGIPTIVVRRQLQATQQITALLQIEENSGNTLEDIRVTLQALVGGNKVNVRDAPGDTTFWAEVDSVDIIELENVDRQGLDDVRAVRLIMTEVDIDA